jgi:serine protease AprX
MRGPSETRKDLSRNCHAHGLPCKQGLGHHAGLLIDKLVARTRGWIAVLLLVIAPCLASARPVAALSPGATIDPVLQQQTQANPLRLVPVIIEMEHSSSVLAGANGQLAQQALDLLRLNGQARLGLPLIDSAAGLANAAGIQALSVAPGVAYVHYDAPVLARADAGSPADHLVTAYPRAVNSDRVWSLGRNGQGVTVAVLDSGISRDLDLVRPTNRILTAVNFADTLPPGTSDPGGHGSHVAGIIAGNGFRSGGQYVGIAPGANLVDVRVLDSRGRGRVSSVVVGIQWALAHRTQYNIRVLNLSLGAQAPASYRADPLSAAVEMAWMRGMVVVVASGNSGGAPDSPGADPYPITVGATDDRGTTGVGDDVVGWFSAYGTPVGSTARPDLVAPGRRIVSLRSPGSVLDTRLADRVVTADNGATYFRLTGTSMSTGVVSGTVALLLQRQPGLTPDQVKAVLKGTAVPFGQASGSTSNPAAVGAGLVDAYGAVMSGVRGAANRGNRPTDVSARAFYPALYGRSLTWRDPLYHGIVWSVLSWPLVGSNNIAWDNLAWDNIAWDNLAWDNIAWDNIAWDNLAWDNLAWDNLAWDNLAWDNLAWDNIAWDSQPLD